MTTRYEDSLVLHPSSPSAKIAHAIAESILAKRACVLLGAGISMQRASYAPGWQEMVLHLIEKIVAPPIPGLREHLKPHLGLLFNETFFQIMSQELSHSIAANALRKCLDVPSSSNIHRFFAHCVAEHDLKVLTTNFDELIEKASPASSQPVSIVKLHGTLSDSSTLRFQINSVFAPLAPCLCDQVNESINDKDLIVGGYGGMDIHDVMPAVFASQHATPKRVFWIRHPGADPIPKKIMSRFLAQHDLHEIEVDLDSLMRQALDRMSAATNSPVALNLARAWQRSESCSNPDWWREQSTQWGATLRNQHPEKVMLLWARLANHLRLYNVIIDGERNNLADKAFEKLKHSQDLGLARESGVQAAYMGRINGRSDTAVEDLEVIGKTLVCDIAQVSDASLRSRLKNVLGLALHHRGVALQTKKLFAEADHQFTEAVKHRTASQDPELHYSLFQQYMNARLALNNGKPLDERFYTLSWQQQFVSQLEAYAKDFKNKHLMSQYGHILHNIGFTYQCMAEDAERRRLANDMVVRFADKAREHYEQAAEIREDIRDPRMIVQSLLRLGEIYLMLATRQPFSDAARYTQLANSEQFLYQATKVADRIARINVDISREEVRQDQLRNLRSGLSNYRQRHFPPWYQNWLPVGLIATAQDVDREAEDIRSDPSRGWHLAVVTAIVDKHNHVLMTKLGDYALPRFKEHPWVLPGGSVEPDESPSHAAVRELREEAGFAIEPEELCPVAWICRPQWVPHNGKDSSRGELLLLFGKKIQSAQPRVSFRCPETVATQWVEMRIADLHNGVLQNKYGGIFPLHHAYWARLAQFEVQTERSSPRFLFYAGPDMAFRPWLPLEENTYGVDSHFFD